MVLASGSTPKFEQPPQGFQQKGSQSVLWTAHDENEDDLRYAVLYRGENEKEWKVLKDKLAEKYYTWDATSLPDGAYYLRIVASDAPSNPTADALTTSRDSERFVIDNTPPTIERLESSVVAAPRKEDSDTNASQRTAALKFSARDSTSSIDRAQYSIDGGDWVMIAPIGGVSDSLEERYEFTLPEALTPGEHSIAVRAYDHFENVGSAKTIVNVPPDFNARAYGVRRQPLYDRPPTPITSVNLPRPTPSFRGVDLFDLHAKSDAPVLVRLTLHAHHACRATRQSRLAARHLSRHPYRRLDRHSHLQRSRRRKIKSAARNVDRFRKVIAVSSRQIDRSKSQRRANVIALQHSSFGCVHTGVVSSAQ